MAVTVKVYQYSSDIDKAFVTPVGVWTSRVKDLVFSTKNPGGFSECSFRLNVSSGKAMDLYTNYHHYFVEIGGGSGEIVWQGRIESVTYEPGQASIVCNGLWSNMFDQFYDDYSFSGDPATEHSILNADSTVELDSTYILLAQSFQLSEPLAIRDIAIRVTNDGEAVPGDYLQVSLRVDNGSGLPEALANAVPLASTEIQVETIASEETIFTGLNTSYRLNADTLYWIVIGNSSGSSTQSVTDSTVGWRYDSSAGYTDGSFKYYNAGTWNNSITGDAIFYIWPHPRFYYYGVDVENGDFEDNDASSDFEDWTENAGTGTVAVETTNVYEGSSAAKLTAGSSADTYLYQDFEVIKGSDYTLSFYTRGDGTYGGRYRVYDVTNSADITATTATGVTGTTYTAVDADFTAPASCTRVRVYFYCPSTNTGIAYFDYASIGGDFSSSVDVIYDAITHSHFVRDSRNSFYDDGAANVNPIAFTNNEKPGDVVGKVLSFGADTSSTAGSYDDPAGLLCGIYEDMYMKVDRVSNSRVWRLSTNNLLAGQQALSLTTSLSGMKTHLATLYSGVVGERSKTEWSLVSDMYDKFGYRREGLFSIAGASEVVADIITDIIAIAYGSASQELSLAIGPYIKDREGIVEKSYLVRAGDIIMFDAVLPQSVGLPDAFNTTKLYIKETSYDATTNVLTIVPANMNMMLVDVILALAGLSGGSMI